MKRHGTNRYSWLWPIGVALLLYGVAWLLTRLLFAEGPYPRAVPVDLALHLALGALLGSLFKRRWVFLSVFATLTLFIHLGHAAKTVTLGAPMSPDDLFALKAFLMIIAPWQRALLLLAATLFGFALLLGIGWKQPRRVAALALVLGLGASLVTLAAPLTQWMDRQFGYVDWDPSNDYRRRGPTVHSLQEISRFLATRKQIPSLDEVASILMERASFSDHAQGGEARNVHVIVLESFWDAGLLKAALDQDPLPRDFRKLWAATDHSRVLSPVFGGYTANAEFEALCGFPVTENSVRFERNVTRQVDCLPSVLRQSGYLSVASHPNTPAFWNRHNVYQRIGFDRFWAGTDFVYDDMNGDFLSDRSLYRQVLEKIEPLLDGEQPLFNYVLTFFGHLPYPLSDDRPRVLESRSAYPEVDGYANTLYYKARELMDFLAVLRERDPESLIVVFGDHLPVLGNRYGAYVESGLVAANKDEFTPQMHRDLTATPLVIIDGRRGPVSTGDLPLFRLPSLVLNLLGNPSRSLLAYTAPPPGLQVRPLPGMHINLLENDAESCQNEPLSESCRQSSEWLRQVEVLATDLFIGAQYALPKPGSMAAENSPAIDGKAEVHLPAGEHSDSVVAPAVPETSADSRRTI